MARPLRQILLSLLLTLFLVACGRPDEQAAVHAARASELLVAGDFVNARAESLNAVQISPKNATARFVLARLAERDGDISQMLGHLEIVVSEDPQHLPARLELARVLFFGEDYSGAERLVEQAERLAPDDPGLRLIRARLAINAGDLARAQQDLDFILARDPRRAEAALLRGTLHAVHDPSRAVADLSAAISRVDVAASESLRRTRLQLLRRLGVTDLLEQELLAMQADYPDENYTDDLVSLYLSQGRLDEAEAALRLAARRTPGNPDAVLALALFQHRTRQDAAAAERTMAAFTGADAGESGSELLQARYLELTGREREALRIYRQLADNGVRSPAARQARNRMAAFALAANELAEARQLFDQVLAESPDDVDARIGRAQIAIREGRTDEALSDLRAAVRKVPEHEAGLLLLARTHARAGQPELAERAWRRLLQTDPDQPIALGALGVPRSPSYQSEKSRMSL